jgi:hypothetical protein
LNKKCASRQQEGAQILENNQAFIAALEAMGFGGTV